MTFAIIIFCIISVTVAILGIVISIIQLVCKVDPISMHIKMMELEHDIFILEQNKEQEDEHTL